MTIDQLAEMGILLLASLKLVLPSFLALSLYYALQSNFFFFINFSIRQISTATSFCCTLSQFVIPNKRRFHDMVYSQPIAQMIFNFFPGGWGWWWRGQGMWGWEQHEFFCSVVSTVLLQVCQLEMKQRWRHLECCVQFWAPTETDIWI